MTKCSQKHNIPFWKQDKIQIEAPIFGYKTCNFSPLHKYDKDGKQVTKVKEYIWDKLYKDIILSGQEVKDKKKCFHQN